MGGVGAGDDDGSAYDTFVLCVVLNFQFSFFIFRFSFFKTFFMSFFMSFFSTEGFCFFASFRFLSFSCFNDVPRRHKRTHKRAQLRIFKLLENHFLMHRFLIFDPIFCFVLFFHKLIEEVKDVDEK